jgi:hypothetical protein
VFLLIIFCSREKNFGIVGRMERRGRGSNMAETSSNSESAEHQEVLRTGQFLSDDSIDWIESQIPDFNHERPLDPLPRGMLGPLRSICPCRKNRELLDTATFSD